MPIILLIVYSLPQDIKTSYFVLQTPNPNIPSLLLSNYNHSSIGNLLNNIEFYLPLIFIILALEKRKERLYVNLFLIFLVLPIIASLFSVIPLSNRLASIVGFSVIVSALLGYNVVCVYTYLKELRKIELNADFVLLIFLVNLSIAECNFLGMFGLWLYLLLVITLITTVYSLMNMKDTIKKIVELIRSDIISSKNFKSIYLGKICFVAFAFGFLILGLSFILPAVIKTDTGFTNILGHYIGYILGLLSSSLVAYVSERIKYYP